MLKQLQTKPWWLVLIMCVVVSVVVELAFFNYKYFWQYVTDYERIVVLNSATRSDEPALAQGPVLIDDQNTSITFELPEVKLRNVRLDLVHPNNPDLLVRGKISVRSTELKYLFSREGNFVLSTRHHEHNNIVLPKERVVTDLHIEFERQPGSSFYVSAIIVNDHFAFAPSPLRILLMFMAFAAVSMCLKYRLYAQVYDPSQVGEAPHGRYWAWGVLGFNLILVLSILLFNNTITGNNAKSQCYFPQECTFEYGSEPGSLLQNRPQTYEERYNSMVYSQQFDAWLKGQTALDVSVNPRVMGFADVYDMSEFYRAQVGWLFDHVIYEGRYYNYYGVAPLILVYTPVYALTGKFPTPILTTSMLSLLGVLCSYWALSVLVRVYRVRTNLLLYMLAQMALPGMALLYFSQTELHAAQIACLSGYTTGLMLVASGYECLYRRGWRRYGLAVLTAVAVVLVVLSRPHVLFVAGLFFMPLLWHFLGTLIKPISRGNTEMQEPPMLRYSVLSNMRSNLSAVDWPTMLLLCGLVVIGAVGVMAYNYVRFGSVVDFGQYYMVTASANLPKFNPSYDVATVTESLYHVLVPSTHFTQDFPFVDVTPPTADDGSYYTYPGMTLGLLAFSANYALFLLLLPLPRTPLSSSLHDWRANVMIAGIRFDALRLSLALVFAGVLVLGVFNSIWGANLLMRYSLDGAWAAALVALVLLLCHLEWQSSKSGVLLYIIAVAALLGSLFTGYMLNFMGSQAFAVSPDWLLELINTFRPFLVQA